MNWEGGMWNVVLRNTQLSVSGGETGDVEDGALPGTCMASKSLHGLFQCSTRATYLSWRVLFHCDISGTPSVWISYCILKNTSKTGTGCVVSGDSVGHYSSCVLCNCELLCRYLCHLWRKGTTCSLQRGENNGFAPKFAAVCLKRPLFPTIFGTAFNSAAVFYSFGLLVTVTSY